MINIKDKELVAVRSGHGRLEAVRFNNDFSSFSSYIKIKDKRLKIRTGGRSIWSWTIGSRQFIVSDVAPREAGSPFHLP